MPLSYARLVHGLLRTFSNDIEWDTWDSWDLWDGAVVNMKQDFWVMVLSSQVLRELRLYRALQMMGVSKRIAFVNQHYW